MKLRQTYKHVIIRVSLCRKCREHSYGSQTNVFFKLKSCQYKTLFVVFSQEEGEEAARAAADRAEAVQAQAAAVPAAHPGPCVVQEVPRLPRAGRARPHRVLQAVQARPAAQLRHVRAQQLLPPADGATSAVPVPRTPRIRAVPRASGRATAVLVRVAGSAPSGVRAAVQRQQAGPATTGTRHGRRRIPAAAVLGVGVVQGQRQRHGVQRLRPTTEMSPDHLTFPVLSLSLRL